MWLHTYTSVSCLQSLGHVCGPCGLSTARQRKVVLLLEAQAYSSVLCSGFDRESYIAALHGTCSFFLMCRIHPPPGRRAGLLSPWAQCTPPSGRFPPPPEPSLPPSRTQDLLPVDVQEQHPSVRQTHRGLPEDGAGVQGQRDLRHCSRLVGWRECGCQGSVFEGKVAAKGVCLKGEWLPTKCGCQGSVAAKGEWLPRESGCQGRVAAKGEWLPRESGCQGRVAAKGVWLPRESGCQGSVFEGRVAANEVCLKGEWLPRKCV